MHLHTYAIVNEAYSAWKRGDLEAFGNLLAEDVGFSVPPASQSFVGSGAGREELKRRLKTFLDGYEVLRFDLVAATPSPTRCVFRIEYSYKARSTGMDIEGTQRHIWDVHANEITSFAVAHDAQRLGAFFELAGEPGSILAGA